MVYLALEVCFGIKSVLCDVSVPSLRVRSNCGIQMRYVLVNYSALDGICIFYSLPPFPECLNSHCAECITVLSVGSFSCFQCHWFVDDVSILTFHI